MFDKSSTDGIVALLKAKEGSSRARTRALDPAMRNVQIVPAGKA